MVFPLVAGGWPRADEPCPRWPLGVTHHESPPRGRCARDEIAFLTDGMAGIVHQHCERIGEDGRCFVKGTCWGSISRERGVCAGMAMNPGCPPDSAARNTRRADRAASPSRWWSLRTRRRRPRTPSDPRYASSPTRCVPGPALSSPPGRAPRAPPPRTAPRQPRIQSRSRARTGVMTFRCQPLQVLIEIHPSMEDLDDFERVRFLAQDQEM